jgi:hypothetical protein
MGNVKFVTRPDEEITTSADHKVHAVMCVDCTYYDSGVVAEVVVHIDDVGSELPTWNRRKWHMYSITPLTAPKQAWCSFTDSCFATSSLQRYKLLYIVVRHMPVMLSVAKQWCLRY